MQGKKEGLIEIGVNQDSGTIRPYEGRGVGESLPTRASELLIPELHGGKIEPDSLLTYFLEVVHIPLEESYVYFCFTNQTIR